MLPKNAAWSFKVEDPPSNFKGPTNYNSIGGL